jgi:Fe(3+) dicitrate transport protein
MSRRPTKISRTLLLIAALSVTPFMTPLAAATIRGRVVDPQGRPIARTTVVLHRGDAKIAEARTDSSGFFSFEVEAGSYILTNATANTSQVIEVGAESASVEMQLPVVTDEITVLGSRIATTPERIPGAVTVLEREAIVDANPTNLTEVLRKAPGINVRDEEGFSLRPNIGIRGLNPTRSTKVLLLEDGLPLTYAPYGDNAAYYHPPLERFESIEILKGAGQIAYGPVTVGGVINYLTPVPPATPELRLKIAGGSREYFNGHLGWGGTWGKTGLLVDLMRKQGDGARDNVHSELTDVNFKVVQALSEAQSLTLRATYYSEDSNVTYSGLTESEYADAPRQNPFANDFFYGDRLGASLVHRLRFDDATFLATSVYGSKFKRHWWRQSSNSGQRPNDSADPNCAGMANLHTTCGNEGRLREYYMWGVEPRLYLERSLFGVRHDFQVGVRAHFEAQERLQVNGESADARSGRVVEDNARDNRAYSLFVQDRLALGRWTLSPGVRVEQIDFERDNRLANNGTGAGGHTSLTQVVPGIGVSYDAAVATFFAGVHRGFAPPRTEDIITNSGGVVDLDPELSWNSELGVRLAPRPGVQIESTIFRMDYENQVVPASLAGGVGATLTNGGETLHQGVEIGARFDTAPALGTSHNAYATVGYTFVDEAKFVGRRFSGVSGFSGVSIGGNRLPYAPEHLLTAGVGYLFSSGLEASVEAVHVSEQFGDDLNTVAPAGDGQRGLIPSYTIWNAAVNYELPFLNSRLFVAVKNAFDELYIADRTRGIVPGPPRLVQAGVSFKR